METEQPPLIYDPDNPSRMTPNSIINEGRDLPTDFTVNDAARMFEDNPSEFYAETANLAEEQQKAIRYALKQRFGITI